jgi:galactokinase
MPVAIDFYSYSAISDRADRSLYIHTAQFKETVEFDLDHLAEPPRKHWSDYVRGVAAVFRDEGYPLKGCEYPHRWASANWCRSKFVGGD